LQERGYTVESLYAEIESESGHDQHQVVLEDFAAILLSAVRAPAKNRQVESVCRYHRALAEALEPGDCLPAARSEELRIKGFQGILRENPPDS
jgi:hypothetical protein